MGWFTFFKKQKETTQENLLPTTLQHGTPPKIETEDIVIPEHIFIEKNNPVDMIDENSFSKNGQRTDLASIYNFIKTDNEQKGYNDAHVTPDEGYKSIRVQTLLSDLQVLIEEALTNYNNDVLEFDARITAQERTGLIDTVDRTKASKNSKLQEQKRVNEIQTEKNDGTIMNRPFILSYEGGFMRGIASIGR